MAKSNNSVSIYGVLVSLAEAEASAIAERVAGPAQPGEKLNQVGTELMRGLAKGGVMIPPEWAVRISAAIGATDPASIVEAVEKSAGRCGEATRVEWIVDPTHIAFYQMQADNAGVSLNHQVKAHLDYAYEQGWLGGSAPDPFKLLLTAEQYRHLQQIFHKDNVTGADVIERLSAGATPEEEYDPIMESLKGGK